jgi:hypothetical protein
MSSTPPGENCHIFSARSNKSAELATLTEDQAHIQDQLDLAAAKAIEAHDRTLKAKKDADDKRLKDAATLAEKAAAKARELDVRGLDEAADVQKELLKRAEESKTMTMEFDKNLETQLAKDKVKIYEDMEKEMSEGRERQRKRVSMSAAAAPGAGVGKDKNEEGVFAGAISESQQYVMQLERAKAMETDPEKVVRLREQIDQETQMQEQYANKIIELQQKIAKAQQASVQKMSETITSGVMSWLDGTEHFGRAMEQMWLKTASAAVRSTMQIMAQQAIGHAFGIALDRDDKLSSAKLAAVHGWTAGMKLPFPLNMVMAPTLGALGFAGAMAFDRGGISEGGLSITHPREMVLPPRLSDFVQKASESASGEGGGGNFNYTANVHAIDTNSMEDALKAHGETIFKLWHQQVRNRNI